MRSNRNKRARMLVEVEHPIDPGGGGISRSKPAEVPRVFDEPHDAAKSANRVRHFALQDVSRRDRIVESAPVFQTTMTPVEFQ
jgi:hypothetical protein